MSKFFLSQQKKSLTLAAILLLGVTPFSAMAAKAHKTPEPTSASTAATNPNDPNTIAIDISQLSTTKEEVAMLQVLSEICPPMLNKNQQAGFKAAYNVELQRLMPTISDPRLAIQYLSSQQDYKQILEDTRRWTLSYPKADNQQLCSELANSAN